MSKKRAPEAVEYYWLDENCVRNAHTWDDCDEIKFTKEQQAMFFGKLPVLGTADYQPREELPKEADGFPDRFMVVWKGRTFYVYTDGRNYCRYTLEVV
jgi:hypothetical protein